MTKHAACPSSRTDPLIDYDDFELVMNQELDKFVLELQRNVRSCGQLPDES